MQTVTLQQPTSVLEEQREDQSRPWVRRKTGMAYTLTVLDRLEAKGKLIPLVTTDNPEPAIHPLNMDYYDCLRATVLPPVNISRRLLRSKLFSRLLNKAG